MALDYPGQGQSDSPERDILFNTLVDDAETLIYELGLEQVIPVGHSLGSMVGIDLATRLSSVVDLFLLEAGPIVKPGVLLVKGICLDPSPTTCVQRQLELPTGDN